MKKITYLINNKITFSLLFLIYPLIYFLSNNIEAFDSIQILIGVLFVLGLIIINVIIDNFVNRFLKNSPVYKFTSNNIITPLLSAIEGMIIANNLFAGIFNNIYLSVLTSILILLVISIFVLKNNIKILSVFMIIAIAMPGYNCIKTQINTSKCNNINYKIIKAYTKGDIPDDLKLKKTPNIYYFYMESYSGSEFLKREFNFDNSKFYNFLRSKGFDTRDICSNYNGTITSLYSTFLMNHIPFTITHNGTKKFLSGNDDNNHVLNILKANNYEINYYFDVFYYYLTNNNKITRCVPKHTYTAFISKMFNKQKKNALMVAESVNHITPDEYYANLIKLIEENKEKSKQPQFYFIKGIPVNHMDMVTKNNPTEEMKKLGEEEFCRIAHNAFPEWLEKYPKNVEVENEHLTKVINKITEIDPNAVILLMSDHGSGKYVYFGYLKNTREELKTANISQKQYAQSGVSIIYALRYPFKKKFEFKCPSNVNVFRYIFAELSENQEIINTFKPAISLMPTKNALLLVAKNGKILDELIVHEEVYKSPMISHSKYIFDNVQLKFLGIKLKHKTLKSEKELKEMVNKYMELYK